MSVCYKKKDFLKAILRKKAKNGVSAGIPPEKTADPQPAVLRSKNWWGMLKSSCLTITEYTRSGAKYQGQFV